MEREKSPESSDNDKVSKGKETPGAAAAAESSDRDRDGKPISSSQTSTVTVTAAANLSNNKKKATSSLPEHLKNRSLKEVRRRREESRERRQKSGERGLRGDKELKDKEKDYDTRARRDRSRERERGTDGGNTTTKSSSNWWENDKYHRNPSGRDLDKEKDRSEWWKEDWYSNKNRESPRERGERSRRAPRMTDSDEDKIASDIVFGSTDSKGNDKNREDRGSLKGLGGSSKMKIELKTINLSGLKKAPRDSKEEKTKFVIEEEEDSELPKEENSSGKKSKSSNKNKSSPRESSDAKKTKEQEEEEEDDDGAPLAWEDSPEDNQITNTDTTVKEGESVTGGLAGAEEKKPAVTVPPKKKRKLDALLKAGNLDAKKEALILEPNLVKIPSVTAEVSFKTDMEAKLEKQLEPKIKVKLARIPGQEAAGNPEKSQSNEEDDDDILLDIKVKEGPGPSGRESVKEKSSIKEVQVTRSGSTIKADSNALNAKIQTVETEKENVNSKLPPTAAAAEPESECADAAFADLLADLEDGPSTTNNALSSVTAAPNVVGAQPVPQLGLIPPGPNTAALGVPPPAAAGTIIDWSAYVAASAAINNNSTTTTTNNNILPLGVTAGQLLPNNSMTAAFHASNAISHIQESAIPSGDLQVVFNPATCAWEFRILFVHPELTELQPEPIVRTFSVRHLGAVEARRRANLEMVFWRKKISSSMGGNSSNTVTPAPLSSVKFNLLTRKSILTSIDDMQTQLRELENTVGKAASKKK